MQPLTATDLVAAPTPTAMVAAEVLRGTSRLLHDLGHVVLPEFGLACGRRADVLALGPDGCFVIVEIKSCRQDFLTDRKWPDYLGYADRFYFAVAPGFPEAILPEDEGLILADRFEGALVRPAQVRPLAAARRKALLLSFARTAASRLRYLTDSGPELGAI
jgi:hypothetical protein